MLTARRNLTLRPEFYSEGFADEFGDVPIELTAVTHERSAAIASTAAVASVGRAVSVTFPEYATTKDNFNYTENPISNSGKWDGPLYSATRTMPNANGSAITGGDWGAYWTPEQWANGEVYAKLTTLVINSVWCRVTNPKTAGLSGYAATATAGQIILSRVDAGANTNLVTVTSYPVAAGDRIALRARGTTLEVLWQASGSSDWVRAIRTTDATYASGYSGLSGFFSQMDDFGESPVYYERSAAIDATASVAATGTFFSIFERSAALGATGAIASTGQRLVERSAALSAAGSITSSGEFQAPAATVERSASLSATATVTAADQERDLLRSASVSATGAIALSGIRVRERSASVSATAGITAGHQRDLLRSASANAAASISSTAQRELLRAAQLAATGDISAVPQRDLIRSAVITAEALIESSGARFDAMTYGGGSVYTYSAGTAMSYAAATTSTYGSDEDWTYGGTLTPTYTYGG